MAWFQNLRAQYLVARNRTSEAARIYREILRSDPIHIPAIYVVLSDCRMRGAADEAIDVATRALAVDDEHFMALQTLAWAYVTQENHSAARVAVAKALEQFRVQRLGEPSNTLRAIEVVRPVASRRRRSPAEDVAESLKDWERWAESYLKSQSR